MWYIWSNENSPVYGKEKMATLNATLSQIKKYRLKEKTIIID